MASIRDAAMVDDACAIEHDSSEGTSPDPTRDNLILWASKHDISYDHYNPNHGVAAKVRLDTWQYPDATLSMQTDLIRRNDHPRIPVKFVYEHTFAVVNNYLSGVSISLAGGALSVSPPTGAYNVWTKEQSAWV